MITQKTPQLSCFYILLHILRSCVVKKSICTSRLIVTGELHGPLAWKLNNVYQCIALNLHMIYTSVTSF